MTTKSISNVSELNKETIGEMYIRSLSNPETRKLHPGLKRDGPQGSLSTPELERDFTGWYGGLFSLCHALDPGVDLPPAPEMVQYITQQKIKPVKQAIAA
jgi:hypothetical protein